MAPLLAQLNLSLVLFFIALFIRAIFAFLETSITALRLFKLKELAQDMGERYEALFQCLEKNPHRVLITTLIVSSFSDVTCAAIATNIMETVFQHFHLSSGLGFSFGIGFAGIMIILFGEILPKNLARSRGDRLFKSSIWLINIVYYALYPLASILIRFSDSILYRVGGHTKDARSQWVSSEQEIQFLINYIHAQGILEKEIPGDEEFNVDPRLKQLLLDRDFGPYAENDTLRLCFLTDNDITGGNSGSPVIDANGNLIGLAFDGNWEAMTGDLVVDPVYNRTISVDIRYVLFVIDKFANAQNLISELDIVKTDKAKAEVPAGVMAE